MIGKFTNSTAVIIGKNDQKLRIAEFYRQRKKITKVRYYFVLLFELLLVQYQTNAN